MTKRKIGSNQHKERKHFLKTEVWRDIWMIAFLTLLAIAIFNWLKPDVISPCPDNGCNIHTVMAGEPENLSTRELVMVKGMRMFGVEHMLALEALVAKESSFNSWAVNPTSGACGLFQAYPCKKMKCEMGDSECQTEWGLKYIKARYKTPTNAWNFHKQHNWY